MKTYIVWMDMDHAKIFKVKFGKHKQKILKRHKMKHHTHADPENNKDCEKFFHDVCEHIKDADEIFVMGPGLAKEHFVAHLRRHHHENLAQAIVGMETSDHISDAKILEQSREFFKYYDLFNEPIAV